MGARAPRLHPAVVHVACLAPLALLAGDLGSVNPIQALTQRTGSLALALLLLSLACTPAGAILGWKWALALRRPLGLYAFLYAALHLAVFAVLDYGLSLGLIAREIQEKRYILAGLAAFLLLLPLAITSTRGWMARLGRGWKRLHRLVYLAAGLAVVHFLWLVKADYREPLLYGAALALLLAVRLPPVRRRLLALLGRGGRAGARPARDPQSR